MSSIDGAGSRFLTEERRERALAVLRQVFRNDIAKVGGAILVVFLVLGLLGPFVAPHDPDERVTREDGSWVKNAEPSFAYPMGTTQSGYPIFSRFLFGARVALFTGALTAVLVGIGGSTAGIVAGYFGGNVETGIMRLVDFAYGVPFLPFAIVLVIVLGTNIFNVIIAISLLLWRETARVVRSEVITIRELPMIEAAQASGASHSRIIFYHIFPKVLPTTVLYSVFAVGWAILTEAGLAFLGFSDPNLISWGRMLQNAYISQALETNSWWWILAPGIGIMLLVMSIYFVSQGIEEVVNPKLRER